MELKAYVREILAHPRNVYNPGGRALLTGVAHKGIYLTPIARIVAAYYRRKGYRIWLRGRGTRKGKDVNMNGDLKVKDAAFCAVYIRRRMTWAS